MSGSRAAHARNLVGPLIRSTYRIDVRGVENLPRQGSVLIVCDWNNIAAPSVLKAGLPRPIHVWAAGPAGLPGPLMSVTGDLAMPEQRPGVAVVQRVVELLGEGEAVVAIGVQDLGYVLSKAGTAMMTAHVQAPDTKRPTDPPARKSEIGVTMGPIHDIPVRFTAHRPTIGVARAAGEWARQRLADETTRGRGAQ